MKSDRTIDEIKTKIDIVDLVSEHVDLKRAGQNFKGLCPFHAEKTPSFMVNPSKQICHCFGCGKGGDIFAFTMHYENINFHEAVSYLANKAGIKVESFTDGQAYGKGIKESIFAIHKEALQFFKNNLGSSGSAKDYIRERGLSSEVIEKFSVGYSTGMRDPLFSHLKNKSFTLEQIKASGLVYFSENGVHDFFRDRIMFPIFDLQGRPVAFGGRKLSTSENIPKYLNSPDHMLFKKGESCYGINIAKNAITQKGYSIVVEGYLDAIMCHQHSFNNTIAPLGTALTAGHLKKLKRFSPKVLLLFDGDPAGISATKRSLELIYTEGMSAKIVVLPEKEDPDTFLRKHGADYFRQYMGKAVTPVEFLLKLYGKNKRDGVRYALSLLLSCPDSLQREETLRELSGLSGYDELTLRQELKNSRKPASHRERQSSGLINQSDALSKEELILLSIIVLIPEKRDDIMHYLDPESMGQYATQGLFDKIRRYLAENNTGNLLSTDFISLCNSDEQALIMKLSVDSGVDAENIGPMIKDCLKAIARKGIARQIELAEKAGDEKLLFSLLGRKKTLTESL